MVAGIEAAIAAADSLLLFELHVVVEIQSHWPSAESLDLLAVVAGPGSCYTGAWSGGVRW